MNDSNNRYGFIRPQEADLIDGLLSTIKQEFGTVRFLEVGVFGGGTVTGIVKKCREIGVPVYAAGVDFPEQKPNPAPTPDYEFHDTDSMDAWRGITNEFNFLFVDGCHCVNHAQADFLNYSPKVVVGGYCLFHDTALPTGQHEQGDWPQDHSYAGKPSSVLGVRKALENLGLLQGHRKDWQLVTEIPSDTGLMGMCLFKKVLPLK